MTQLSRTDDRASFNRNEFGLAKKQLTCFYAQYRFVSVLARRCPLPQPGLPETHELDQHPREGDRVDDLAVPRIVALQKLRCYTRIMTPSLFVHDCLSDGELVAEVKRLAGRERHATAQLIAAIAELDARRLYLGQGCSSMFTYCTQVLYLAEHAAYNRIEAARAARRFPVILTLLADGSVHLSSVRLLAPHLTQENHAGVLREASHKSKREVEQIVARLQPQPDVAASVRKLPVTRTTPALVQPGEPEPQPIVIAAGRTAVPSLPRFEVAPLAPERYKVQFTVGRETYEKLRRVQDLMRHRVPNGDPAVIFERAITLLLDDLEKKRIAVTDRPRATTTAGKRSRHIRAEVRRTVWARDNGRCRFEGPHGRCSETGLLEFHHIVPYADGGATTGDNLELRCAAHNRYEAEQYFGESLPMFAREERDQTFQASALRSNTRLLYLQNNGSSTNLYNGQVDIASHTST
jgi:5-methylcytosine-specific restriction endonuclease McrA